MAKYTTVGTSETSPVERTERKVVRVARVSKGPSKVRIKVRAFYIGGAGDKQAFPIPLPYKLLGPHGNAEDVHLLVEQEINRLKLESYYEGYYLGYYEVYKPERIQQNVLTYIPDKTAPIVIVGHSLGGWNGAHLSGILNDAGYHVHMLVTLDPVGEDGALASAADIYPRTPKVAARHWINIRAETKSTKDTSDYVADLGGQWTVTRGPHINVTVNAHHASAKRMFVLPIDGRHSAASLLLKFVREWAAR